MWVDGHMFNLDVVLPKHLLTALTTLQRGDKQMSNFISLSPLCLLSASVRTVSSSFPTALWYISPSGCSLAKKMRNWLSGTSSRIPSLSWQVFLRSCINLSLQNPTRCALGCFHAHASMERTNPARGDGGAGAVGEETSSHAHFHIPPSLSFSHSHPPGEWGKEVVERCVSRGSEAVEMSTSELESEQSAAALTCFPWHCTATSALEWR